jgi:hypothetical protein
VFNHRQPPVRGGQSATWPHPHDEKCDILPENTRLWVKKIGSAGIGWRQGCGARGQSVGIFILFKLLRVTDGW